MIQVILAVFKTAHIIAIFLNILRLSVEWLVSNRYREYYLSPSLADKSQQIHMTPIMQYYLSITFSLDCL